MPDERASLHIIVSGKGQGEEQVGGEVDHEPEGEFFVDGVGSPI